MASQNVRSLLRAELSTRRISHPHASYANSKSSLLSCNVCHLIIKSESLWEGHLRSANHRKTVQRSQSEPHPGQQQENGTRKISGKNKRKADSIDAADKGDAGDDSGLPNTGGGGGKKRKAEDDVEDDEDGDGRKKTKSDSTQTPAPPASRSSRAMTGFVPASTEPAEVTAAEQTQQHQNKHHRQSPDTTPNATTPTPSIINEAEYAAFEREVLPLLTPNPTSTTAVISAAPISAADLLAQKSTGTHTLTRSSREEEAEAEREDESRRMADEFEVQEAMEARVRRLRERRECIRVRDGKGEVEGEGAEGVMEVDGGRGGGGGGGGGGGDGGVEDDNVDDDDDEEDEFDEWGFS